MIPIGWQIHEGRELVGMSQADLAKAAGVGLAVRVHADVPAHTPMLTKRHPASIQAALEAAWVEFAQRNGGIGVQLRKVDQGEASSR